MTRLLNGIDLGTSTTLLASLRGSNVTLIPDPDSSQNHTESAVLLADDGTAEVVGEIARNQLATTTGDRVVIEPKRSIGTENRFPSANPRLLAHQVMSEILFYRISDLVNYARTFSADTLTFMIGVPAYYGDMERKRTVEAFEMARDRVKRTDGGKALTYDLAGLVDEPLAAAICQTAEATGLFDGTPFIVLDLGGGTFDVTAYQTSTSNNTLFVNVLAKDGEQQLGGADWDEVLAQMWLDQAATQAGKRPTLPTEQWNELKLDCEKARRALTRLPQTRIRGTVGRQTYEAAITRTDFQTRSADLLRRMRECVTRVTDRIRQTHGLDPAAFNVLLVGGATHMPMIQAEVRNLFNPSQVMQAPDPQQVVARGACYYCAIRNGVRFPIPALRQVHDIKVRDILTRSYGIIGDKNGKRGMMVVLPRNTVCDDKEYVFDQVVLKSDFARDVPLEFTAVKEWHREHTFVELPANSPNMAIENVTLSIPNGVNAVAGQRLRVYLRAGENGVIAGRAELMDSKDASKSVSEVNFRWTTGG